MTTTRLKIAKLSGASDLEPIEKALEAVPHVNSVTIDAEANEAVVEHDGANQDEITTAVKRQGYVPTIE